MKRKERTLGEIRRELRERGYKKILLEAAKQEAEEAAKKREQIRQATEDAKRFQSSIDAAGLSYSSLLELEEEHERMGGTDSLAHNVLVGYERGEGWPDGT